MRVLLSSFVIGLLVDTGLVKASNDDKSNTIPTTILGDGNAFPLVGMGVGNLQHNLIVSQIVKGVDGMITEENDKERKEHPMNFRLIDTAHASQNERLVHNGIIQGLSGKRGDDVVHVITKIWYTHLGYERTKMSVEESLEQLKISSGEGSMNIRVHLMLHWPRCNDEISWMHCEDEENKLPNSVKELGDPVPHLNKDTAFLESWRALEDIYLGIVRFGDIDADNHLKVASIGVSNFNTQDLKMLTSTARVTPHILQGNVWAYVFDPSLIRLCDKMGIHFQAYNVMNGIIGERSQKKTPLAYSLLQRVAGEMSESSRKNTKYTPAQIVLKWLVQNDVSVIPRTRQLVHLQENSPYSIGGIPDIDPHREADVIYAVKALLNGNDIAQPVARFTNNAKGNGKEPGKGEESVMKIFWRNTHSDNEDVLLKELLPGEAFDTRTWHGHTFVASLHEAESKKAMKTEVFKVRADFGGTDHFTLGDEL